MKRITSLALALTLPGAVLAETLPVWEVPGQHSVGSWGAAHQPGSPDPLEL